MSVLFSPHHRQVILSGCVAFAKHVGPTRAEAELLPQCWEQITHKYPERRLLVAESCGVLAPYLPVSLCQSCIGPTRAEAYMLLQYNGSKLHVNIQNHTCLFSSQSSG